MSKNIDYSVYCDTYYLTQGTGRKKKNIFMGQFKDSVIKTVPHFGFGVHNVTVSKGEEIVLDHYNGSVKVKDLHLYNIKYS